MAGYRGHHPGHGSCCPRSASSSNLSPLAPPFTVDRGPPPPPPPPIRHMHAQLASAAGTMILGHGSAAGSDLSRAGTKNSGPQWPSPAPAQAVSSLIQAEPFYPHYIPVGPAVVGGDGDRLEGSPIDIGYTGRCAAPWNRPLGGAVGSSQSWMEPKGKAVATSYGVPYQQGGRASGALVASEDKMCGYAKHNEFSAMKFQLDSECLEWRDDKRPGVMEENVQALLKMSGTSVSVPNAFVQHGSGSQKNEIYKGNVAVKVKEPVISVNIRGKEAYLEKNRTNGRKADGFANSSAVKITFPSSLKAATANSKSHSSGITSELKNKDLKLPIAPCGIDGGSSEPCVPKQGSSEALDQLNLAVDSPCWKGASFSQRSPFCAIEAVAFRSSNEDQKSRDADGTGLDCLKLENMIEEAQCFSCPEEERNEVISMKDARSSFRSKDDVIQSCQEEMSGTPARQPVSVTGIANPEIDAKVAAQYCSSRLCSAAKNLASLAVAGVSDEIVVPQGNSDSSGKWPPVGMDISLLVKTTYYLSELLLSSCYGNENALQEHNCELLQSASENLRMCLQSGQIR